MRRKSKKALSILLLIYWTMLLFYWIRDYYGVYPRPEAQMILITKNTM